MDTIENIIATNRSVDASQLAEALKAIQSLRASGARSKGYDLARPFAIVGKPSRPFGRRAKK
jgi:hypothetical protein